jgi:hypothetical protein
MRGAGLVAGVNEAPVRRPSVALEHPGEVLAEDLRGVLVPATGRDQVHRHQIARERPQPRLLAIDPPAGLIGRDRGAAADRVDQRPIGRLKPACLPGDRLHHSAWGDADPEPGQRPSGLLRREPAPSASEV